MGYDPRAEGHVIVVYQGDRQVAEGIAQALRAAGHEVRLLDTFLGAA